MFPFPETVFPAWTFPVARREDELLSSWLSRSAHFHGVPAYAFLSLRFPGVPFWNRDLDLTASPSLLERIDQVAGLQAGSAEAASLVPIASVLGSACGASGWGGHVPFLLSAGVFHRKRRLHGLQYCPACVAGPNPFFRRSGRLSFVVTCPTHGDPLRDGCPSCDAPVVPHRAFVGELGRCHACAGDLAVPTEARRPAGLERASTMQARCLAALAAGSVPVPGTSCPGDDFLSLARSLVAVVTSGRRRGEAEPSEDGPASRSGPRSQIERMRVTARIPVLASLATLTEDWPAGFAGHADDLGLTRRSFARLALPPILAAEVARLPAGRRRHRVAWRSVLDDALMRRLRRDDPSAYRTTRARRILAASFHSGRA